MHRTTPYTVLVHVKQLLMLYHYNAPWYSLQQKFCNPDKFISTLQQLCICISAAQPAINVRRSNVQYTVLKQQLSASSWPAMPTVAALLTVAQCLRAHEATVEIQLPHWCIG